MLQCGFSPVRWVRLVDSERNLFKIFIIRFGCVLCGFAASSVGCGSEPFRAIHVCCLCATCGFISIIGSIAAFALVISRLLLCQ